MLWDVTDFSELIAAVLGGTFTLIGKGLKEFIQTKQRAASTEEALESIKEKDEQQNGKIEDLDDRTSKIDVLRHRVDSCEEAQEEFKEKLDQNSKRTEENGRDLAALQQQVDGIVRWTERFENKFDDWMKQMSQNGDGNGDGSGGKKESEES